MIIRRVGVLSAAKLAGLTYAVIGLFIGACFALFAVAGSAMQSAAAESDMPAIFGFLFGAGAIVILPIFYGVLGFAGFALFAALYNLLAGVIGGLEIEVQQ
ncbi:MAG TPA: hypothetical protein VD833_22985 [Vicinamibacterales bacterium]|nr:hypothetical protein [Vicinamibacterales bacterium]